MEWGIIIAVFLITAVIFTFVGMLLRKKIAESKMKSAELEAKRIIDMANKEAENKKKEEIFKAKEEIMNARKDLDLEIRERRGEVQLQEKRIRGHRLQHAEDRQRRHGSAQRRRQPFPDHPEERQRRAAAQELFQHPNAGRQPWSL